MSLKLLEPGAETVLVAIDGPAGSGKSSVAKAAAKELGYGILDTGSAYRALALALLESGADPDDEKTALAALSQLQLELPLEAHLPLKMNGEDVSAAIRTPQIANNVSRVSKHAGVRTELNKLFRRRVATSGLAGVVIEGRDITTVVAPDAQVRLILTADAQVRAQRRQLEMPELSFAQVFADLQQRDAKDLQVVNFLDPAPGVELIDTTELDFAGSVAAVVAAVTAAAKLKRITKEEQ